MQFWDLTLQDAKFQALQLLADLKIFQLLGAEHHLGGKPATADEFSKES